MRRSDGTSPPFWPRPAVPSRTAIGRRAEALAAVFLELRGFEVLDRNVRDGPRELDLVARIDGWSVVVEVRYRAGIDRGRPEESVRFRKERDLVRAGRAWWLARGSADGPLRFDLVTIVGTPGGVDLRHRPHFLDPSAERYSGGRRGA